MNLISPSLNSFSMKKLPSFKLLALVCAASIFSGCATTENLTKDQTVDSSKNKRKVIVFVWDGLRPDSVTPNVTPNLAALRNHGVNFSDNHSVFPTFTMMNASSLATGTYPASHGFYGNTLYQPNAQGTDSSGKPVDFSQPIFTEDYGIIQGLSSYYKGELYLVSTLFQKAQQAGLSTAAIGKSGPAFIQDYADYYQDSVNGNGKGIILDEKLAFPISFAKDLQKAGFATPKMTTVNYQDKTLDQDKNPTAVQTSALVNLADKVTKDPRSDAGSPYSNANEYMMKVYLDYVLPVKKPDLSVVWFRNPDTTEHNYGPGSKAYIEALRSQDKMLGDLLTKLKTLGMDKNTDVIVVSDHGHSTVAGDPTVFPARLLNGAADGHATIGNIDQGNGFSVSGDTRTADLLTRAGISHVYDGNGCIYDPVLSGIKKDGSKVYPDQEDTDGHICGKPMKYSTPSYKIPASVPDDATIIAANGGSEYIYLPDHDSQRLQSIVRVLQSRKQYGALFVAERYGKLAGTMPMSMIKTDGNARSPDMILSFDFNEKAFTSINKDVPGTEYESSQNNRGMHGSFSPIDIHNTLLASGPDFKNQYVNTCPSGNVDVAPTIAHILGLSMPQADGRVLLESLKNSGKDCRPAQVESITTQSSKVVGLTILDPDDLNGTKVDTTKSTYEFTLYTKKLHAPDGKTYLYFDKAKASRQ